MHLDIIGDIHGHADALEALLRKLGYEERGGLWRHPEARLVIFLGDLIDRGPRQRDVLRIARRMIEADTALIVMGNHEFNAISYATPDPNMVGTYLRPRSGNNTRHHQTFLNSVGGADSVGHREAVAFFVSMPLWLDLPGLRIVHACWSPAAMATLTCALNGSNQLTEAGLLATLTKGTVAHAACEILLKGPEMKLPDGISYLDAQKSRRHTSRMRWWDPGATTLRTACAEPSVADQLPDDPIPPESTVPLDDSKPLFFGHYWMTGLPTLLTSTHACLDFSIAKGGVLCAYRFDGERTLSSKKLLWVG